MASEKLIQAALNRFAEQGYNGASLAEIAADTGIRKASIYAHFPSKNAIYLHLFENAWKKEMEAISLIGKGDGLKKYIFEMENRFKEDNYLLFWLRSIWLPPPGLGKEIKNYDAIYTDRLNNAIACALKNRISAENSISAETFEEAYRGIIRAVHAELMYAGPVKFREKATALWQIFEKALECKP